MRSFLALSLVVIGCGDNLGAGEDTGTHDTDSAGIDNSDVVINKLIPEVCAAHSWPSVFAQDKNLDLRAVPTQQGAAIFSVARDGGALYGFVVDARGLIMGDANGTKVLDGNFSNISATEIDGRLVVAALDDSKIFVNMLSDDLTDAHLLGTMSGTMLGDTLMMYARGYYVSAAGSPSGITASTFDANWSEMGSQIVENSSPLSMTSARYGNDAMVAWSTPDDCHLSRIAAETHDTQNFPCRNNRMASNFAEKSGQMVFEENGGVRRSDLMIGAHNEIANNNKLVSTGKSPRIVFDGKRYWISYINAHGDITLGYLEEDGSLASMAIEGIRPADSAYDLAVIDGSVWLYAFDGDNRYSANKMCLTREGLDPTIHSSI
jgi:hypothetical protein